MDRIVPPLRQDNYIRLLECRVEPQTRSILCNFKIVTLSLCEEQYTAVSYAWEDATPVGKLELSDGHTFPLSRTLSDLFASLQQNQERFTLWINSICISQQDPQEKAS